MDLGVFRDITIQITSLEFLVNTKLVLYRCQRSFLPLFMSGYTRYGNKGQIVTTQNDVRENSDMTDAFCGRKCSSFFGRLYSFILFSSLTSKLFLWKIVRYARHRGIHIMESCKYNNACVNARACVLGNRCIRKREFGNNKNVRNKMTIASSI